jgi:hypothetical protein
MRMRQHYLERELTVADSQTKTIDLKGLDPISAIDIIYAATNGATSNVGQPLHKQVSKIEVIDGADVLFSLNFRQLAALNFYEQKIYPAHNLTEVGGAQQWEKATIHFGRWVGDPDFYLDPSVYKNPQLKLVHNLPISATAGFATGTGRLTAIAHLFDERPPAAKGFLMTKEHYAWTTAASGDETIELPTDYAYRLLMLQAYESGTPWTTSITKAKLGLNEDKVVIFDLYSTDIVRIAEELFGKAEIENILKRADNASPETFIALPDDFDVEPLADLHVANVESITADTVTLQLLVLSSTPSIGKQTTAQSIKFTARGVGPHNIFAMPFGDMKNPDTWLRAQDYEVVKLKVTQGDAGASAAVILQQWRR